jgi:hypothetical protein
MDTTIAEMLIEKTKMESLNARVKMFHELDWLYNQITVKDEQIRDTPNDSDLGQIVRQAYYDKINKHAKPTQD